MPLSFILAELSYYTGGRKAPYAFHHVQNLTDDSAEFIRLVTSQDTGGNVDSPESGMDALMQAIVCDGMFDYLHLTQRLTHYYSFYDIHLKTIAKIGKYYCFKTIFGKVETLTRARGKS